MKSGDNNQSNERNSGKPEGARGQATVNGLDTFCLMCLFFHRIKFKESRYFDFNW
jgi:hypothetical protein